MRTTVFFATNRARSGDGTDPHHYAGEAGPPGMPSTMTHGVAMVDGTDLPGLVAGRLIGLDSVGTGDFTDAVAGDVAGGRNLLVFLHGFANAFSDGIARAAFNREFIAASGVSDADCTLVAFSWPSRGGVVHPADVVPGLLFGPLSLVLKMFGVFGSPLANAYLEDARAADASGADVAAFLDGLRPVVTRVRRGGGRAFLLAHSMGHRALRAAVPHLAARGVPFDEVFLAAADTDFEEDGEGPPFLRGIGRAGTRVTQYVSTGDQILRLSQVVNGVQRLGRDGPVDRSDAVRYPPARFRMVDCSGLVDTGPGAGVDTTHQYYRRVPAVRDDIARAMAGGGRRGRTALA